MLSSTEILAGADLSLLTPEAELALSNMVKRSEYYKQGRAFYGDIRGKIRDTVAAAKAPTGTAQEQAEQVATGRALVAIVTRIASLPRIVVETEGTDTDHTHFSIPANWEEWAKDVLDTLFDAPVMAQVFGVVTRKLYDHCGQERTADELVGSQAGRRIVLPIR